MSAPLRARRPFVALLAVAWALGVAWSGALCPALASVPTADPNAPVQGALVVEAAATQGQNAPRLGVRLDVAPGWHIYGTNPGDAGLATQVALEGSGVRFGPVSWPPSETFHENDQVTTYGYTGRVMAVAPLLDGASDAAAKVQATVRYLACNVTCRPGQLTLTRSLQADDAANAAQVARDFADYDAGRPRAPTQNERAAAPFWWQLVQVLAAAFVGGLLLNAMPCVLPVLALKAVSLTQLGTEPRAARRHAAGYAAGVVASLQLLAGAVVVLRALGHEVGWGFQFQQPAFLAAVATALVVFAANCLGAFELTPAVDGLARAHARAHGARRSFLEGVLAVLVATPCSAPLLGTAMAFALGRGPGVVSATFAAMGLGLAAPYVLLATLPASRRLLPRPGRWMVGLKATMGYALLATAAWLAWVLTRAQGADALAALLCLAWAAAVGAALLGAVLARLPQHGGVALACLIAALVALGGQLLPWLQDAPEEPAQAASGTVSAAPYDEEAVRQALAQNRPVFVDFTADWCVTCQYNERHVLADAKVQAAFARHKVVSLRADWTRRDDAILRTLQAHGRAAVPMYLLYLPGQSAPRLLPEVLTVHTVVRALDAR